MPKRIIWWSENDGIHPEPVGRPLVRRPADFVLGHHTGATGYPRPGQTDAQAFAEMCAFGASVGKPEEYNFDITYPEGWIWAYAGQYRAAHCLDANEHTFGILIQQASSHGLPGPAQIESFNWLVWWLHDQGWITDAAYDGRHDDWLHRGPHYRLRNTACSSDDMAESRGVSWSSPTGQGSLGGLRPELLQLEEEMVGPPYVLVKDSAGITWTVDASQQWRHPVSGPGLDFAKALLRLGGFSDTPIVANFTIQTWLDQIPKGESTSS